MYSSEYIFQTNENNSSIYAFSARVYKGFVAYGSCCYSEDANYYEIIVVNTNSNNK